MNMFGGSVSFLESQFQQRLVQVCLFAAVLFWLLGSYKLIDQVQKLLSKVGLRFGKDSTRVVHALIFAVLLYLLTRFIMDPVVRRLSNGSVVEGQTNPVSFNVQNMHRLVQTIQSQDFQGIKECQDFSNNTEMSDMQQLYDNCNQALLSQMRTAPFNFKNVGKLNHWLSLTSDKTQECQDYYLHPSPTQVESLYNACKASI